MFKKLISLTLTLIISLSAATVFAYAENEDTSVNEKQFPLTIEFVYAPLKSRIVIGDFGPLFAGTVIKANYADGTSELLTVRKTDDGYMAGDYKVEWNYFWYDYDGTQPTFTNYGIVNGVFRIVESNDKNAAYAGEFFYYLNLPAPAELLYAFRFLFKTIGTTPKDAVGFN